MPAAAVAKRTPSSGCMSGTVVGARGETFVAMARARLQDKTTTRPGSPRPSSRALHYERRGRHATRDKPELRTVTAIDVVRLLHRRRGRGGRFGRLCRRLARLLGGLVEALDL